MDTRKTNRNLKAAQICTNSYIVCHHFRSSYAVHSLEDRCSCWDDI